MEAPGIEANPAFSLSNLPSHHEAGHAAGSCPEAGTVDANPSVPNLVLKTAMEHAMASGNWAQVSELAQAMATLSAAQAVLS